ncbi:hypothetical protein NDU88_006273 [Pleurodeles waltl]|uniref:Uncharacterized protein n=1 Tax=Pleurodeles waltl TaxID=8319 RepID=A0AAV7TDH5_PLEWA|nr:hypothetical protein NDU88_006273 [Pleurodeles waltl]
MERRNWGGECHLEPRRYRRAGSDTLWETSETSTEIGARARAPGTPHEHLGPDSEEARAASYGPLDQLSAKRSASTQNGSRSCVKREQRAKRRAATGGGSGTWSLDAGEEPSRQNAREPVGRALRSVQGAMRQEHQASVQALPQKKRGGGGDTEKRALMKEQEVCGCLDLTVRRESDSRAQGGRAPSGPGERTPGEPQP